MHSVPLTVIDVSDQVARIVPQATDEFLRDHLWLIGVVNGPNLAAIGPAVDQVAREHELLLSAWCGFLPITLEEPSLRLVQVAGYLTTFVIAESYKVAFYIFRGDHHRAERALTIGNDASMKFMKRCFCSCAEFKKGMETYGKFRAYIATAVVSAMRDFRTAEKALKPMVSLTDSLDLRPRTYAPHKRYQNRKFKE